MDLTSVFSQVLQMSLTGCIVILIVYLARLLLKRVPKIYSYALWLLVLFRLLCPFSLTSDFAILPDEVTSGAVVSEWSNDYVGDSEVYFDNRPEYDAAIEAGREPIDAGEGGQYVVTAPDGISEPNTVENTWFPKLAVIWLVGMGAMLLYSGISYGKIRRQVRIAVPFKKNVYLADDVESPFVMGFLHPKIYLPGTLTPHERRYIIQHERHHIRRGDHIFKALGFLALTIHWFNPLVWLAFILASRDMEMSCDEAVIRKLGEDVRAEYSATLLNLATGHRIIAGTPLAFGEGDPKGRIRNLAKWKKPKFWVILICVALCIVLAVCLLTNPGKDNSYGIYTYEQYYTSNETGNVTTGIAPEGDSDAVIAVKFKRTSGLSTMSVSIKYKAETDSAWTSLAPQNLNIAETCIFQIPAGSSYIITASPVTGQNGYATFEICDRGIFSLADLRKRNITRIKLQNAHNGQYTFLEDGEDIADICAFLQDVSGVDYGTSKGYYEGTYAVSLQYEDGSEEDSVVFGDSTSFTYGEGEDGYPIRYEMLSHDILDVVAFFSQYDSSGYQWKMLEQAEETEPEEGSSAFGVTMTARDQTQSSVELVFTLDDVETEGTVWFGETYHIFLWDNNQWYELALADAERPVEPAAVEHLTQITPGQPVYQTIDWYDTYGNLPEGKYRIQMTISQQKEGYYPTDIPVFAEFSLSNYQNWAVSTQAHDVTGEHLVLTYHSELDDPIWRLPGYTIQSWLDGYWVDLDVGKTWHETTELVDFDHQSNPQNGMFIQWDGIGSLPQGNYLIGQEFCTDADLTKGHRFTVYAPFEITAESDGIKSLEELPELYSAEQAMIDGCFVNQDSEAQADTLPQLQAFMEATNRGETAFLRIVNWYYGDNSFYTAQDLTFDGNQYILEWIEDGQRQSRTYRYLKHFTGEKERENMAYDAYEHYVLVNDNTVTWQQIYDGLVSSQFGANIDHWTIASDYIYYTKHPDLPDKPNYAILEFMDEGLVTILEGERLEKLTALFENGEYLGYEPKTHSIDGKLKLLLNTNEVDFDTNEMGDFVIELDPDQDICRINGEYVFYGAADEPDYIQKLWEYLGITQWPDIVYMVCENALRP